MKNLIFILLLSSTLILPFISVKSQTIDNYIYSIKDSLNRGPIYKRSYIPISESEFISLLDYMPSFGLGGDTYFLTGFPTNDEISNSTSDVKFQVSIRQRLTKSDLPLNIIPIFVYNQKSFWSIYASKSSRPFKDNNYNPAVGFKKFIFKDDRLIGSFSLFAEHESNGRDSIDSRSWNYFSLSGNYFFNPRLNLQLRVWIPFEISDNKDLLDYRGIGFLSLNYLNRSEKLRLSVILNPSNSLGRVNLTVEVNFKLQRKINQYIFFQFFNGYAEGLLNYRQHTSMIRAGICIKPNFQTNY